MKRSTFFLFLIVQTLFISIDTLAQGSKWRVGLLVGVHQYKGDLGSEVGLKSGTFGGRLDVKRAFGPKWNLGISGELGHLDYYSDTDGLSPKAFDSDFIYSDITAEYNLIPQSKLTPFLKGGIGLLNFEKEQSKGVIPFGGGLKYYAQNDLAFEFLVLNRKGVRSSTADQVSFHLGIILLITKHVLKPNEGFYQTIIQDADDDGIVDEVDQCVNLPGPPENLGCPFPDFDEDGVLDKDDKCRDIPGDESANGCPDKDGDSIPDDLDFCPNDAGLVEFNGCVVAPISPLEALLPEIEGVVFKLAVKYLDPISYPILDRLVQFMLDYPEYDLAIAGHTDSTGNAKRNQYLSEQRAKSTMKYLTDHGIVADRIITMGYGSAVPIATNKTPDGRLMNRRVEFELTLR